MLAAEDRIEEDERESPAGQTDRFVINACGVDEDAEREGFRWPLDKSRPRRGRSL
jgi:hypothetical protein